MRKIKDMYDGNNAQIRIASGTSEHFMIVMELHQRSSTLSPFPFPLVMDNSRCHIKKEVLWCMLLGD